MKITILYNGEPYEDYEATASGWKDSLGQSVSAEVVRALGTIVDDIDNKV
jgi:hypothetical protein